MIAEKRLALKEAVRDVRDTAETACAVAEYGSAADRPVAEQAARDAYDRALKLADELAAELDRAHVAIRRAARSLRGLPGTYTVGPGNWERVLGLVLGDAAGAAAELERDAGL